MEWLSPDPPGCFFRRAEVPEGGGGGVGTKVIDEGFEVEAGVGRLLGWKGSLMITLDQVLG